LNAKHVLIVEDNPHLRRILAGALEQRGYTISEATTGDEAIVTASKENPKLILLDLSLPDMTGTEAARALKQNPQTAHIPIVGCSAHFGPEWRDQGLALWNGWLCAKAGSAKRHRGDYRAIHPAGKIKVI
jgi:CheY-like chemotaxis protein